MRRIRLATRSSRLALAQAEEVRHALEKLGYTVELKRVTTHGDRDRKSPLTRIGGSGLFVSEIEQMLLQNKADLAVHSGKDLPYELMEGLVIGGVPAAEDGRDCLVTRKGEALPKHPRIGTGSPRRVIQGRNLFPGAEFSEIRGNVDTRLRKLSEGSYDAVILARAGLNRLMADLSAYDCRVLDLSEMLPAPCQGILAVECRAEDEEIRTVLQKISDPLARKRFAAERCLFRLLMADCSMPVGVRADLSVGTVSLDEPEQVNAGERMESGQEILTLQGLLGGHRAVRTGRYAEYPRLSREIADELLRQTGSVCLVGAGCGRDLITVKGLRAIRRAEVAVYDDLVDHSLLMETPEDCRWIYVGKRSGKHSMSQEAVSRLLVEEAQNGRRVIRLKGGDSFVFGRGGEEILALQEAGIPYEVIPGVTSSVAVPGHAGIPVTHRQTAQSFAVITGHSASDREENYRALAQLDGTLVFLMGLGRLPQITGELIRQGKPADTPAAVVSCGFEAGERRYTATLGTIAAAAAGAQTPAVLVVGDTAGYHMEGTIRRPLQGIGVTVTGTPAFAGRLEPRLADLGADTEILPCLRIIPAADCIPEDLTPYQWLVFTSGSGVEIFFEQLRLRKTDIRSLHMLKIACIGSGTAGCLERYGIRADFVPSEYTAECLGRELPGVLNPGDRVLILRAEQGSPDLNAGLDRAGIDYADTAVYRTCREPRILEGSRADRDYIVFASASGVRAYFESYGSVGTSCPVCIGESTKRALMRYHAGRCLVPRIHTAEGLAEEICKDTEYRRKQTQ
jgi:uroporphyrinogen III methyltransferase/synthase